MVILKYCDEELDTFRINLDPTFTGIVYTPSMILINFNAVVARSDTFSPGNEERERPLNLFVAPSMSNEAEALQASKIIMKYT